MAFPTSFCCRKRSIALPHPTTCKHIQEGQSGDPQRLSSIEGANNQSVQDLADSDQAREAEIVEGVEDAADHPERPVHTHLEYGRPDDVPTRENGEELEDPDLSGDRIAPVRGESKDVDVEDLPDEEEDADRLA